MILWLSNKKLTKSIKFRTKYFLEKWLPEAIMLSNNNYFYSFKRQSMLFHWSLSNSKSLQVSRTLLSIPAYLKNAVVWMVSSRLLISKSPSPCTNPLVTVPSAPITTGITVSFTFHSFFSSQTRSKYLTLFQYLTHSLSVLPCGPPER